jgi:predicted ATPase
MSHLQKPDPSPLLAHDGRNLAGIVKRLADADGNPLRRVADDVQAIGAPMLDIRYRPAGSLETVVVTQHATGGDKAGPSEFEATSLSDGTLRALGILVSFASALAAGAGSPTLIGIEEPETSLHPAAAAAMLDALLEAATTAQLVVTTRSPDLLEHDAITPEMIRPVILEEGRTVAGSLDPARGELLRNHLSTAGELLRLDRREPDPEDVRRQQEKRNTLLEGIP